MVSRSPRSSPCMCACVADMCPIVPSRLFLCKIYLTTRNYPVRCSYEVSSNLIELVELLFLRYLTRGLIPQLLKFGNQALTGAIFYDNFITKNIKRRDAETEHVAFCFGICPSTTKSAMKNKLKIRLKASITNTAYEFCSSKMRCAHFL